jgi:ectoine hydroxylase-related dioxygenase (phytanoyl-CoA dioxygenase family)
MAAQQIGVDTRKQPKPEEPVELDPQLRLITRPGGVIAFSGAQLHSSVPNTTGKTRFSIDFRTVHIGDVAQRVGAPNIDSECTGTCMNDYLRIRDLAHVPAELQALYEDGTPLVNAESALTPAGR